MIKTIILCVLGLVTSVAALSQHLSGYELEREMPVFGPAKARVDVPYGLGKQSGQEL